MRVNPVTGKMEKAEPAPEGKHRDGCLVLDDKYVNAAKNLGLGGAEGDLTDPTTRPCERSKLNSASNLCELPSAYHTVKTTAAQACTSTSSR